MKNYGKTLKRDASKPNLKNHSRLLRKWGHTSYNIEKTAHRQPLNQNGKSKSKTPVIIVKFASWSFSEKVKSGFIEASRNGENSNNGFSDVLHRPSGAVGAEQEGASPPPPILQSSMLMCPFLLVIPLNVLFLKEVTNNVATWKSTSSKWQANWVTLCPAVRY